MIDFKDEISKYKPIKMVDDVEDSVRDELVDLMDIMQNISGKKAGGDNADIS